MSFLLTFLTCLHLLKAASPDHSSDSGSTPVWQLTEFKPKWLLSNHSEPEFLGLMENITVPAGRSVRLSCAVKNLGPYKVAWMHFEQSAILAVHSHVITRNPRITVSHENHRTWNLHIADVKQEDGGRYMCQINTATAKTQFGYLHVVVPPDIEDSLSSSDIIVREGSNVTLSCSAKGSPEPTIKWRRDDNQPISINKTHTGKNTVVEVEGPILEMSRISRLDMGAYLCIASNGVPPSVSKRIRVSVDFPPMLWIPHQLVGSPLGRNVTLECFTEAHPNSLNYWTREDGQMIHDTKKYHIHSKSLEVSYKTQMMLTIVKLKPQDFGTYKCVAKNPRGETDGTIRLYYAPVEVAADEKVFENNVRPTSEKGSKGFQSMVNVVEKQGMKNSVSSKQGIKHVNYQELTPTIDSRPSSRASEAVGGKLGSWTACLLLWLASYST